MEDHEQQIVRFGCVCGCSVCGASGPNSNEDHEQHDVKLLIAKLVPKMQPLHEHGLRQQHDRERSVDGSPVEMQLQCVA